LRGGNWNNGVTAGVFALSFNNARSLSNWNVGFRAALLSRQILKPYGVLISYRRIKGFVSLPLGKKSKYREGWE
jgi:hypothetical protein